MSTFPLPMPVMHSAQVSSLSLFKEKRDFRISIIVDLVATAAIAASITASALALSATVQTTQTINDLSARVTSALDRQAMANS
ncbi:mCG1041985 [Mus musculus]|nr:mCG1041985 [Mus musculus]